MEKNNKFYSIITSSSFIGLILLGVYLLISGYHYGWDDQHLEIPLLKHLIDNNLYNGDYYVESLKANFTSFFYPILAKLITVEQIPSVYFTLYLISRYFLFFYVYKLWLLISESRFKAFSSVIVLILMARVSEFLYRTFSHQEFALAIIFAGIYYFFKDRLILSAVLLGLAANIHALYAVFPMFFIGLYMLWQIRQLGWKKMFCVCLSFILTSLPVLIWIIKNRITKNNTTDISAFNNWVSLYIIACPQNFFFPKFPQIPFHKLISDWNVFYYGFQVYIYLAVLFVLNLTYNDYFKKNKKAIAFAGGCFLLLIICFIFTYVHPNRFVLDLNLSRNTQYLLLLLVGYTTIFLINKIEKEPVLLAYIFALGFVLIKYGYAPATLALTIIFSIESIRFFLSKKKSLLIYIPVIFFGLIIGICLHGIFNFIKTTPFEFIIGLNFKLIIALTTLYVSWLLITKEKGAGLLSRKIFIIIPLFIFTIQYSIYHYKRIQIQKNDVGFWGLQNSWEDMQRFVKDHTEKSAVLLAPYNMEMGGFRIGSERRIISCYRDCGIVGFDFNAAVEWLKRINDIKAFKVQQTEPTATAVQKAIMKYNVDYIVFMRYSAPKESAVLKRLYTNNHFVLYEVVKNNI